jgi:O-antigen/teichoic acid export membrane protein
VSAHSARLGTSPDAASAGRRDEAVNAVARGGALNLVAAAVSAVTNVLLVLLVTRGFSKAEAGIFFAATSVFLLGARIAELGTGTGVVYFLARARALRTPQLIPAYLRTTIRPVFLVSLAAGVVLGVGAPTWARLLVHGDPGHFALYLRILAVFLPVSTLSDTYLAATRGFGKQRPTAVLERIGRPLLQVLLTIGAVVAGSGIVLTTAWVAPYLVSAALAWWWLTRLRRSHEQRVATREPLPMPPAGAEARRERSPVRQYWSFTAPRALASIAQLALQRMDIVLITALRGPVDAAIYTAATRFLVVGQMAGQAISQAVQPKVSELLAVEDHHATNQLYQTATCWLVLATWPFYLTFAVLAPFTLQLFGHGYADGSRVVLVLTGAMLVATGCGMVDTILTMAGRTTWNLGNAALALVVDVVLDLLLIPHIGILGAAIGWAAAILTNNLVPLSQVALMLRLHPLGRGTLNAMAVSGLTTGVVPFAVAGATGDSFVPVLLSAIAGLALFGIGCWIFRTPLHLVTMLAALRGRPGSELPGQLADAVPVDDSGNSR